MTGSLHLVRAGSKKRIGVLSMQGCKGLNALKGKGLNALQGKGLTALQGKCVLNLKYPYAYGGKSQ